jgi:transketolase
MKSCLDEMFASKGPSYFRLGLGKNMPDYLMLNNNGASSPVNALAELTIIVQSPVANNLIAALNGNAHQSKVDIFIVNKMPLANLPSDIAASIKRTKKVITIEEHVAIGGVGSAVSFLVHEHSLVINKFVSLHAKGYPGELYGSQSYHQQLSGLDKENISKIINSYF